MRANLHVPAILRVMSPRCSWDGRRKPVTVGRRGGRLSGAKWCIRTGSGSPAGGWTWGIGGRANMSDRTSGHKWKEHSMGVADDAKGKAKEAVGDATGNRALKNEGKVDRGKGKVKDAVDRVAEKVTGR